MIFSHWVEKTDGSAPGRLNMPEHGRLELPPQVHHPRVEERQDLRAHQPGDAPLAVAPPVRVRQPGPVRRPVGPARRRVGPAQHERQAPALRGRARDRVQVGKRVRQVRLRGRDALPPEVREPRDLVCEHRVDGGFGEQPGARTGARAVVEEDGEDA